MHCLATGATTTLSAASKTTLSLAAMEAKLWEVSPMKTVAIALSGGGSSRSVSKPMLGASIGTLVVLRLTS